MDVKKFKLLNNIKEKENIRDFLDIETLEKVQKMESNIACYIEMRKGLNFTDKETYEDVKKYVELLLIKLS